MKTTGDQTIAGVKTFSSAPVVPGLSDSGNLTFTGTGNRITGDFSNATIANRVMFQTSTVNGNSQVEIIPNGSGTQSNIVVSSSSSDPANASIGSMLMAGGTEVRLQSGIRGTGTYLPMTFYTGGSERMRIETSGNVLVTNNTGGLGYGTGSGGTVTQATSKSTAVTLNKPTGQITMNNAALGAGAEAFFTFNCSLLSSADTPLFAVNYSGNYTVRVYSVGAGSCGIAVKNISAGSLSEAVTLNFAIIKGTTS